MFIVCGFVKDFGADRENFQPQMDANKRKCKFWDPAGLVFIHVHLRFFMSRVVAERSTVSWKRRRHLNSGEPSYGLTLFKLEHDAVENWL